MKFVSNIKLWNIYTVYNNRRLQIITNRIIIWWDSSANIFFKKDNFQNHSLALLTKFFFNQSLPYDASVCLLHIQYPRGVQCYPERFPFHPSRSHTWVHWNQKTTNCWIRWNQMWLLLENLHSHWPYVDKMWIMYTSARPCSLYDEHHLSFCSSVCNHSGEYCVNAPWYVAFNRHLKHEKKNYAQEIEVCKCRHHWTARSASRNVVKAWQMH